MIGKDLVESARGAVMSVDSWLNLVRPPEEVGPPEVRRWHWNVSVCLLGLLAFAVAALTPIGFAREPSVDQKITAAKAEISAKIEEVAAEQRTQGSKIDQVSKLLTEQLASTVSAQIRLNISKRCKATGFAEREQLNSEKDRLQGQYFAYKGAFYVEPACGDL